MKEVESQEEKPYQDSFEHFLQVIAEEIVFSLPDISTPEIEEFYLNPRYLRGSDFLMRWSQGRWAEEILIRAFAMTREFRAVPYGPSSVAPSDPVELEAYFKRLDAASDAGKRPDILIFTKDGYGKVRSKLEKIGLEEIPFIPEENLEFLLSRSIAAVEVETSLWVAKKMPHFGKGKPIPKSPDLIGFAKSHKVPTIIIKEEDLKPLIQWERKRKIPLYVFHVFHDLSYYIPFKRAIKLIREGIVPGTAQTFYAPSGPTTTKTIYKIWYTLGYPLGEIREAPKLVAKSIEDKNGHILPYVHFLGGKLILSAELQAELRKVRKQ